MPAGKLIGGVRKNIAAPAQAPPTWPVSVEVDFIDGEAPVKMHGYEAVLNGDHLIITTSPTEQIFVRLETVRTFKVIGAPVRVASVAPALAAQPAPQGPPKTVAPLAMVREAMAKRARAEAEGGGEIPASIIVNPDGTTEQVLARMD